MSVFIIDENIPIVANDAIRITEGSERKSPQANLECILSCIQKLQSIMNGQTVLLDSEGTILAKYRAYLSNSGQPGVGDIFMKYLSENCYNPTKVISISITKNAEGAYHDFPETPELTTFDPADRIFVALSCATIEDSKILNAVDSDYKQHKTALDDCGVAVEELCPDCLKETP